MFGVRRGSRRGEDPLDIATCLRWRRRSLIALGVAAVLVAGGLISMQQRYGFLMVAFGLWLAPLSALYLFYALYRLARLRSGR